MSRRSHSPGFVRVAAGMSSTMASKFPWVTDKKLAFQRFHELMTRPKPAQRAARSADTFVGVCDAFLEWTQKNRAPRTYKWYVERLQSFCQLSDVD